jgi:capsular polysaccharide biosynthesis protein
MGICERAYAAKADDGTTSGSGLDNYSRDTTDKAGSGKPWNSLYVSRQRESFRVEPDEMGSYR